MQIDIEDFRIVTESYGMQLDDDMILATFSKVCPLLFSDPVVGLSCHTPALALEGTWHIHQYMHALYASALQSLCMAPRREAACAV